MGKAEELAKEIINMLGPKEAEAAPLKGVAKEAYRASVKAGGKKLYHFTDPTTAEKFVASGMEHPRVRKQNWEDWKPAGTYFSPTLNQAAELVPGGGGISAKDAMRGNWDYIGETPDVVRGVLKSNKVLEVEEEQLARMWDKYASSQGAKRGINLVAGGWPFSTNEESIKAHQNWSRLLGRKYDALVVKNVDGIKGATEVIAMNPKAVKLFHKDMKWPIVAGATTAGAMMVGSAEAAEKNPNNYLSPEEVMNQMEGKQSAKTEWITPEQVMNPEQSIKGTGWANPTDVINSVFGQEKTIMPKSTTIDGVADMSPVDYELLPSKPTDTEGAFRKLLAARPGELSSKQELDLWKQVGKKDLPLIADLALMVGSSFVGGGAIKTIASKAGLIKIAVDKLGPSLGKLAIQTIEGLGAGAVYESAKAALGDPAEGLGITGLPGEETAMWGAFPTALKVAGKTLKGVVKGVDWASKNVMPKSLTELGAKGANAVWENVIVKPTTWELPGFKKSVGEMFQPGVERLAQSNTPMLRMVASTFRKGEAMKSLSTEAGRMLSNSLKPLLPSEQYEVMQGLRGTALSSIKSPKAKDVLWQLEQKLKEADLTTVYDIKFRENLSTLLTKPIEEIEASVGSSSITKLLQQFESKLPQKASVGAIHDMMKEIIEHPHITSEMKQFVKELWSMPAKTPLAVADATRKANTYFLMEKLTAYRGLVSKVEKPGYIKSEWGRLAGQWIPRDVELELQTMSKVPQIARGMYQKWFLSPWKVSKTITRPAYHVRNLMSNLILNDWGGLPFYRVDVYMDALKGMRNNSPAWQKFRQMTGAGGTFVQRDLYQLESGMKYGATMSDKLYSVYERGIQPLASMQAAEENLFKFAKYQYNITNKMKPAEAALDAMKWTFNFGEITPEIAQVRKWGAPFFTWYAKAIPLAAETAVKHPIRFWKWLAVGMEMQNQALQAVGMTDNEWGSLKEKLPDYIQKGLYLMMPWRDDKGRLNMLNMTYIMPGIGDINEFYQRSIPQIIIQNPLVSLVGDIKSKKKFSGAPLYYDWEPAGLQASKTFAYIWEQIGPSMLPGGTDWNSIYRSINEEENAPSTEASVAGLFGFKITPVDPSVAARRSAAIQRIHESEMTMEMKRELRRARTHDETNAILKKYQDIRKSIVEP